MATQAISAFGIQFRLGDGVPMGVATLTDATNTSPIIVTTAIPHGLVDVSFGTVVGVTGNTGANGSWVIEHVTATTLKLRGSVGTGAYGGGGTLQLDSAYTTIAELTNVEDLGGQATLVDVTSHDAASAWSSRIPTFLDTGNMRLSLNHVPANLGHQALWSDLISRQRYPMMIVLPDGATAAQRTAWHMTASVVGWTEGLPVGGALTAQVTVQGAGDLVLART